MNQESYQVLGLAAVLLLLIYLFDPVAPVVCYYSVLISGCLIAFFVDRDGSP
jgi:hypothetical protein